MDLHHAHLLQHWQMRYLCYGTSADDAHPEPLTGSSAATGGHGTSLVAAPNPGPGKVRCQNLLVALPSAGAANGTPLTHSDAVARPHTIQGKMSHAAAPA